LSMAASSGLVNAPKPNMLSITTWAMHSTAQHTAAQHTHTELRAPAETAQTGTECTAPNQQWQTTRIIHPCRSTKTAVTTQTPTPRVALVVTASCYGLAGFSP
jgi:hypothetical protein